MQDQCCKDRKWKEALFYGLISGLVRKNGYTKATNKYLAGRMGLKQREVSYMLKYLRETNWIVVVLDTKGCFRRRKIYTVATWNDPVFKQEREAVEKHFGMEGAKTEEISQHAQSCRYNNTGIYITPSNEKKSPNLIVGEGLVAGIESKEGQKQDNSPNLAGKESPVGAIYDAYKSKIQSGARLTPAGRNKIVTRLKAFSEEELLRAIANFSGDGWWMAHNSGRGVVWFFYSDDRIEAFLNIKSKLNGVVESFSGLRRL